MSGRLVIEVEWDDPTPEADATATRVIGSECHQLMNALLGAGVNGTSVRLTLRPARPEQHGWNLLPLSEVRG